MRFALTIGFLVMFLPAMSGGQPASVVRTQPGEAVLEQAFTTDDGLPQNTPTALVQAKDGYLWIATYGGLARFDGSTFKVFTTTDYPGLINNRLTALAEDRAGTLWIGSEHGDLMTYQDGAFHLIWKAREEPHDGTIWDILVDRDGVVWLGTYTGLKNYDPRTNILTTFPNDLILKEPLKAGVNFSVRSLATDSSDSLWMASNVGLIRYRDGEFEIFDVPNGLPRNDLWAVQTNANGNVIVAIPDGIFTFDGSSFQSLARKHSDAVEDFFDPENPASVFFWNNSLVRPGSDGLEVFPMPVNVANGDLRSFVVDREGNLWLGTQFDLIQVRRRIVTTFALREDGVDLPATSIIETPDGSIWVTSRGRVLRFHGSRHEQTEIFDLGQRALISLAVEPVTGTLWLGSEDKIFRFHEGRFKEFNGVELAGGQDLVLFFDRSNTLWIGAKSGGLRSYRDGVTRSFSMEAGLVSNRVTRIIEDRQGRLWIGTPRGFSILENGRFQSFTTDNGLTNNYVRDFYEDKDGSMWIGTYGGGMLRFKDGVFTPISDNDGLAENIVSRILADDEDNFWILGNRGIFSVARQALSDFADGKVLRVHCVVYGKRDGMTTSEGNGILQPAGWRASDGKLWFPMIQGGVVIDPRYRRAVSPPIYIENIRLDGRSLSNLTEVRVKSGEQNLEIHYTGLTFTKPDQLQFRYKLEGFDRDWQDVGTRRVAYYPYLPPGKYTFKVQPVTQFDDAKYATLAIAVDEPFWRTTAFYLIILLAVVGLISLLYQLRLRRLDKLRRQQLAFSRQLIEAHESERKRIATDLHDGIGHSLLVIANWARLAVSKFDRNAVQRKDIDEIASIAVRTLEETRTISANLRPKHLERFGLTSTLEDMMLTINESSRMHFDTDVQNVDLLFSPDDELSIYRVVQECMNNILKHSNAQHAVLRIRKADPEVHIFVNDDGVGFDLDQNGSVMSHSLGLNSIRERVQLLNGRCVIRSIKGKGTSIDISVPIQTKRNA